jgi:AbrB family looped-hinge helix DNA binding protein
MPRGNGIRFPIMANEATIDAAGRLVIPKSVRERLRLDPGTRLRVTEQDGRIVLDPERPEPRLVERDGFLAVEFGAQPPPIDASAIREERLRDLVDFAMRR